MSHVAIEKTLPTDPVHASAVLHVRRHLKRNAVNAALEKNERARSLALLFGRPADEAPRFLEALTSALPIHAAARILANGRTVVSYGHDEEHVEACRQWLSERKAAYPSLEPIIAFDLETLCATSMAIDAAQHGLPVIIHGETGTGKELVSRAIHDLRPGRRTGPFVPVQVAGMPAELINDELFGHVKGAFTGAAGERAGRIEEAADGTLLIDEVGDLPAEAQVRLLRFLQDGKISRLGTNKVESVRIKILAATWKDLPAMVESGEFRRDLYPRLAGVVIKLPPLRARSGTVGNIARELARRIATGDRRAGGLTLTKSAVDAIERYSWPGNVRGLENALRFAAVNSVDGVICLEDLPEEIYAHYLTVPLHERAIAFLGDEPEGGGQVDATLLRERIQIVSDSVEKVPLTDETEQLLSAYCSFTDGIGGSSAALSVAQVREFRESRSKLARDRRLEVILASLAKTELSPDLAEVIKEHREPLARRLKVAETELRRIDGASLLQGNPWWSLALDIQRHPLTPKMPLVAILNMLRYIAALMEAFTPELRREVENLAGEGGLKALLPAIRRSLAEQISKESDDDDLEDVDNVIEVSEFQQWDRPKWAKLVANHRSKSEAQRATGIDRKTITKYLKRFEVRENWGAPLEGEVAEEVEDGEG